MGSAVTNVILWRGCLSDSGQLAFVARLADGSTVVVRATPR